MTIATTTTKGLATGDERCLTCLPKADLHLHLEGAMRQETLSEFATRYNVPVPTADRDATFDNFQRRYRHAVSLIRTPENLRRVAEEVVQDARASGAVWIEPQFNPTTYAPSMFPHAEEALEFILDASAQAAERHRVGVGAMLVASRNRDPRRATMLARIAAKYAHLGVAAFGLAGDERAAGIEEFTEAFRIAKQAGLILAPHVGEFTGADQIGVAIDALGPDRIAHGVRAIDSVRLMELLAETRITLDVSLRSNLHLGVVRSLREHPLPALLNHGVRCTLGSDDPLLLGTDLVAEYASARRDLRLSDEECAEIASTSLSASAAPTALIKDARGQIHSWLLAAPHNCTHRPASAKSGS